VKATVQAQSRKTSGRPYYDPCTGQTCPAHTVYLLIESCATVKFLGISGASGVTVAHQRISRRENRGRDRNCVR